MSFDAFLDSNGQVTPDIVVLTEKAKPLNPIDIRVWRDDDPENSSQSLRRLIIERRTRLWALMLQRSSSDQRLDNVPVKDVRLPHMYTLRPQSAAIYSLPLQQDHMSPYAIPPELADTPCGQFTAAQLISEINGLLDTSVSFAQAEELITTLLRYKSYDFGMVYAIARRRWPPGKVPEMCSSAFPPFLLAGYRQGHSDSGAFTNTPPHRVWDLYSNRVFDYIDPALGFLEEDIPPNIWAVSHSWVAEQDRHLVTTPINGGRWPVPIPKATTLDHIRIELLNMGAEYVFLDVLCLRQESADNLALRMAEWGQDVPAMGHIYRHDPCQTVVTYFSGLGLPFNLRRSEFESPFHWINRAWTVQEATLNWLPGGLGPTIEGISSMGAKFMQQLNATLAVTTAKRPGLDSLLDLFCRRPGYADKKPYDQIAALSYLLPHDYCRQYSEKYSSAEEALNDLVIFMRGPELLYLLVCCPLPRRIDPSAVLDRRSWWPTWSTLMSFPLHTPPPSASYAEHEMLQVAVLDTELPGFKSALRGNETSLDYHLAYVLRGRLLDSKKGALVVRTPTGQETFPFKMFVNLNTKGEEFTLVGVAELECWIVCRAGAVTRLRHHDANGQEKRSEMLALEKVTVGRMPSHSEREKLFRLNLGVTRLVYYTSSVSSTELPVISLVR